MFKVFNSSQRIVLLLFFLLSFVSTSCSDQYDLRLNEGDTSMPTWQVAIPMGDLTASIAQDELRAISYHADEHAKTSTLALEDEQQIDLKMLLAHTEGLPQVFNAVFQYSSERNMLIFVGVKPEGSADGAPLEKSIQLTIDGQKLDGRDKDAERAAIESKGKWYIALLSVPSDIDTTQETVLNALKQGQLNIPMRPLKKYERQGQTDRTTESVLEMGHLPFATPWQEIDLSGMLSDTPPDTPHQPLILKPMGYMLSISIENKLTSAVTLSKIKAHGLGISQSARLTYPAPKEGGVMHPGLSSPDPANINEQAAQLCIWSLPTEERLETNQKSAFYHLWLSPLSGAEPRDLNLRVEATREIGSGESAEEGQPKDYVYPQSLKAIGGQTYNTGLARGLRLVPERATAPLSPSPNVPKTDPEPTGGYDPFAFFKKGQFFVFDKSDEDDTLFDVMYRKWKPVSSAERELPHYFNYATPMRYLSPEEGDEASMTIAVENPSGHYDTSNATFLSLWKQNMFIPSPYTWLSIIPYGFTKRMFAPLEVKGEDDTGYSIIRPDQAYLEDKEQHAFGVVEPTDKTRIVKYDDPKAPHFRHLGNTTTVDDTTTTQGRALEISAYNLNLKDEVDEAHRYDDHGVVSLGAEYIQHFKKGVPSSVFYGIRFIGAADPQASVTFNEEGRNYEGFTGRPGSETLTMTMGEMSQSLNFEENDVKFAKDTRRSAWRYEMLDQGVKISYVLLNKASDANVTLKQIGTEDWWEAQRKIPTSDPSVTISRVANLIIPFGSYMTSGTLTSFHTRRFLVLNVDRTGLWFSSMREGDFRHRFNGGHIKLYLFKRGQNTPLHQFTPAENGIHEDKQTQP